MRFDGRIAFSASSSNSKLIHKSLAGWSSLTSLPRCMDGIHDADRPIFAQQVDLTLQRFKSSVKTCVEVATLRCWKGAASSDSLEVIKVNVALKKIGRDDIMVVVGGVIPSQDYQFLKQNGADAVFGPGTFIPDAAREILGQLNRRVG